MKVCLFTAAVGDYYQQLAEVTHPTLRAYAEKIGAEFVSRMDSVGGYATQKWQKFEIYDLLNTYDRVLWVDTDIIIRDDAPDIFELVPRTEFGIFNEGKYEDRTSFIRDAMEHYNIWFDWKGEFYNSGVMVVSRPHKQVFRLPKDVDKIETDQILITLRLLKEKYKVFDLPYRFNRMSFLDQYIGMTRKDSYFIHYAGAPRNDIFRVLNKDLSDWKTESRDYKRSVVISVSGGMGDQLCSEPVIRYARKKVFKPETSDLTVVTHHKRLFEHIEDIELLDYDEYKGKPDATLVLYTNPEDSLSFHHLSHVLFHPTDFAAMSTIRQTLSNEDKTIKLSVREDDLSEIRGIYDIDYTDTVAVHCGRWWPSKTFPREWWQEVVDGIAERAKVVLIGKTIDDEQGYVEVDCPANGYDLRDLTSLGGLIAVISQARVTLTNDSCPVHIAGAFDNRLVVIPTCKQPDHILPFRDGGQLHKTTCLYGDKLLYDDLDLLWLSDRVDNIDAVPGLMERYLPSPSRVIEEVFS